MPEPIFATWAPRYVAKGFHVHPLLPGMKEPWTPNGFKDATTDAEQIEKWCKEKPTANIGIVPGKSGMLVLDVDPKNNGQVAYEALKAEIPELNQTIGVRTGGGGLHLYFRVPEGLTFGKTEGALGQGLDTRSMDGYVCAPQSLHPNGRTYEWIENGIKEPLILPAKLIEKLQAAKTTLEIAGKDGEKIYSGQGLRQTFLWGRACGMRGNGDDEATIYEALTVLNENRLVPPKPDDVVRDIAHRAAQYQPNTEELRAAHKKARNDWTERKANPKPKPQKFKLTKFSDIEERKLEWLMPGYLAFGKFNLCWGMEGRGKTYGLFAIAAMISQGIPLPGVEMSMGVEPGEVVIVTYEDDPEDTLKPRLRMCGADQDRVYTIRYDEGEVSWRNPEALAAALDDLPNLKMLAIDPITSYAIGIDESKEIQVREAINPLVQLAFKKRFALVGIKHANKSGKSAIDDRVSGSRGWTALARSVFLVGHDNRRENEMHHTYGGFIPTKGNLSSAYPPLSYEIDNGVFKFTGIDKTMTVEDLMPKTTKEAKD